MPHSAFQMQTRTIQKLVAQTDERPPHTGILRPIGACASFRVANPTHPQCTRSSNIDPSPGCSQRHVYVPTMFGRRMSSVGAAFHGRYHAKRGEPVGSSVYGTSSIARPAGRALRVSWCRSGQDGWVRAGCAPISLAGRLQRPPNLEVI